VAFYQKGVELLSHVGQLTYISPNTFLNGDYFKKLRLFLTTSTKLRKIWDYKSFSIFDDPTVFVCVLTCTRTMGAASPYGVILNVAIDGMSSFQSSSFQINGATERPFKNLNPILERMGVGAFVELDAHFFVKDVGFNYWTKGRGKKRGKNSIGDRVFYAGKKRHKRDMPFLKGRDIRKWYFQEPSNFLKHDFENLLDDADTLRYSPAFLSQMPKIIYRQTANTIIAAIDPDGHYLDKTVHLIVPKKNWNVCSVKLLLALLNSKLFAYFYPYLSQETEGRAFAQVKTTYIKKLPIPLSASSNAIDSLVNRILEAKQQDVEADVSKLEREIDRLVYALYGLTPEEVQIVEGPAK
jgi:adenine-specific DNA-methyltransferase